MANCVQLAICQILRKGKGTMDKGTMEKEKDVSLNGQSAKKAVLTDMQRRRQEKKRIKENKEYVGFKRFKVREIAARAFKAIMLGLTAAFVCGGVYTLITKFIPFKLYDLRAIFIVLIFLAIFFWCGVIMSIAFWPTGFITFFALRRKDKAIAKSLDENLKLKEAMQTSVEYSDDDSQMARLLRLDLKEKTDEIKTRRYRIKRLPIYIISLVLSGLFIFSTLCVPYKILEKEPDKVEPFKLTEMQKAQLESIIIRVNNSNMEADAKAQVADEIRALIDVLVVTDEMPAAMDFINLSVKKIDKITKDTGTSFALYEELVGSDNRFTREIGRLLTKFNWERYAKKREDIRAMFDHKEFGTEEADIAKITSETIVKIRDNAEALRIELERTGTDPADPLYGQLIATANKLEALANDLEQGYINYRNAVGKDGNGEIYDILTGIYAPLDKQYVNYEVGFGASDEIRKMFELPVPQREDNTVEKDQTGEEEEEEDEEQKDTDGGGGNGDVYGSNDIIYEKEKGHISYGEVYDIYYKIMSEESYTPEQKKAIQEYFEILSRGLEEKKGD